MKSRLATLLIGHAATRLRRRRPEWANAMVNESGAILSDGERLRWSIGCAIASYRAPGVFDWVVYPAALIVGIALMAMYQWSADESLRTVAVLALIGLALGVLQPNRSLISGATTGLVVAAVNGFETITGVRPAYETAAHSLLHDARWIVLIAPALFAAVIGGYVGVKLRSVLGAGS
jgi:hypothetical protein